MSTDLPNVLNRPFKVTYKSGRCQYVTEGFAKIMLGEEYTRMAAMGLGGVYLDIEGDEWEHMQLESIYG
jgi:hypothetical protein